MTNRYPELSNKKKTYHQELVSNRENTVELNTFYRIVNGLGPEYPLVYQNSQYILRNGVDYIKPVLRLDAIEISVLFSAIALWIQIPKHIGNTLSLGVVKR